MWAHDDRRATAGAVAAARLFPFSNRVWGGGRGGAEGRAFCICIALGFLLRLVMAGAGILGGACVTALAARLGTGGLRPHTGTRCHSSKTGRYHEHHLHWEGICDRGAVGCAMYHVGSSIVLCGFRWLFRARGRQLGWCQCHRRRDLSRWLEIEHAIYSSHVVALPRAIANTVAMWARERPMVTLYLDKPREDGGRVVCCST